MKKIRVQDAVGEVLCHDVTAIFPGGQKGPLFRRGHVIREEDVEKLLDIGKSHLFVWETEADEVHEEDAAFAVTKAICGHGITYSGPSEGKYQLIAETDGLYKVNSEALRRINRVEDFTVASLPGNTPVTKGGRLAGARIVPLVTGRRNVQEAVRIANENAPVFEVRPYIPRKTGIIITGSEIYYGRIQDAFEPVLREKLEVFGANILGVVKCPDDLSMIAQALAGFMAQQADMVLFTGGMSVDPDDLTPTAIRESGATLLNRGVAMQPGNMLTMAYLGDTILIGVPGASLHSKVTSLDLFLPRICAGERITEEDTGDLGEGGFCLGCKVCHYPVCYFGRK